MDRPETVKVWDPVVRVFHWSLVAAFTVAYLSADEESVLHTWSGYAVLGLVLFRILWGLIGTRHARFSDFVYPPSVILTHAKETMLGRAKRYMGHNPLGGMMIVFMLASLLATALTGLALEPETEEAAFSPANRAVAFITPAHADSDREEHEEERENDQEDDRETDAWEETLEEMHEFFANLTLLLVFIHIAGVVLESLVHRENLVRAMFSGRKYV